MGYAILYTFAALVILTWVGNLICRLIFELTGLKNSVANLPTPTHSAGRWIGVLERLIFAIGIIVHSWEILAAVIALKTVARFREMDERDFAEYFLVGSLFSIFWTMLVTSAWIAFDHNIGTDIMSQIEQWLGVNSTSR